MSDQPSAPDPPAVLLVKRLTDLADALGSDAAFRTVVLDRLMYLVTGYEDPFNQEQFDAVVLQYRSTELDSAILRAVADALDVLEIERRVKLEGNV